MTVFRLMTLVLLAAGSLLTPAAAASPVPPDGTLLIYDEAAHQLIQLQEETLAPLAETVPFGERVDSWDFARSADGSTLVNLDPSDPRGVIVRDGRTGRERARFATGRTIAEPVLSADGSRLLVALPYVARGWALFDVATGAERSTFTAPEGWVEPASASPDLSRLYYLTIPTNDPLFEGRSEPHPALVAVDLAAGTELARIPLPDIVSGYHPVEVDDATEGGGHVTTPGLAVSPDGSLVAVVRGDRTGFTLIDAATMTIERTTTIVAKRSGLDRVLTWAGILPRRAAAKMETADVVSAAFGADGSHLYVWGFRNEPEPDEGRQVSRGIGLLAVDAATGEIVATGPEEQLITRLAIGDGALYVTGPSSGEAVYAWAPGADLSEFDVPHLLQRLDAETLAVQAETTFPDPIWLSPPA